MEKRIEPWVKIEKRIIFNTELTINEKMVIIGIVALANDSTNFPTDEEGYTTIATQILADKIGMSRMNLTRIFNSLIEKGVLLKKTHYVGNKKKTPLQLKVVLDVTDCYNSDVTDCYNSDVTDCYISDVTDCYSNKDNIKDINKENWTKESDIIGPNNITYIENSTNTDIENFFKENGIEKGMYNSISDWSNFNYSKLKNFCDRTNINESRVGSYFAKHYK